MHETLSNYRSQTRLEFNKSGGVFYEVESVSSRQRLCSDVGSHVTIDWAMTANDDIESTGAFTDWILGFFQRNHRPLDEKSEICKKWNACVKYALTGNHFKTASSTHVCGRIMADERQSGNACSLFIRPIAAQTSHYRNAAQNAQRFRIFHLEPKSK